MLEHRTYHTHVKQKIKISVLPGPVLIDSSMSNDSTLMVDKDRVSVSQMMTLQERRFFLKKLKNEIIGN